MPLFTALVFVPPGGTSPKGAQVVIHSTLVTERGDRSFQLLDFSIKAPSNLFPITPKTISMQGNLSYPGAEQRAHPQH